MDNPSDQVTVVAETAPNTRTAPPLMPPPVYRQPVSPADITLDPISIRPRRKNHGILIAWVPCWWWRSCCGGGVDPEGSASGTAKPATVSSCEQCAGARATPGDSGLHDQRPDGWKRSESTQGDRSDVLYIGPQPDPQVGAPEVQVRRDTTGTTARQYLANRQKAFAPTVRTSTTTAT
ncbi:hypothetical protein [Kibdelosporangium philippinense]|uniref:hypothetical protein n=1 Tax=Kibdelosporangium philippinense TaxID=211113 RepID=UPI003616A90A